MQNLKISNNKSYTIFLNRSKGGLNFSFQPDPERTPKEKRSLCKILWPDEKSEWMNDIYQIYKRLIWVSSSLFGYMFKDSKQRRYSYIVKEVARKFKIGTNGSVRAVETRIIQKVLKVAWEKMSPSQRKKVEQEIKKAVEKESGINKAAIVKAGGYYAFLAGAQLSGFGIYLAATTALGFITRIVGITLPFVIYTSLTRAISIIIGPPGWIIGGILLLLGLKQPNYKILIPAIVYVAGLRVKYE